ncbi:hypothetical protein [Marinobacter profundi]|uniref:Uncharacterized protein n=1 Tax=Marinobacter profundi TaxID=2666256 RepID=A0A2G1UJD6_9GAMM|nr:hypothetical protein [Marinobacter profundi]PHQ14587.1 hypothetical protein CLH61_12535 [Marinobacter profundi]
MLPNPSTTPHPWRKRLLATEFIALAILLGSMAILGRSSDGGTLNPAWLIIPAAASLAVFLSFIGLMYLRWVVAAEAGKATRHKLVFGLLAVTLLGVWVYGIANTWLSMNAG